jgi:AcrR family transcriptional regulator
MAIANRQIQKSHRGRAVEVEKVSLQQRVKEKRKSVYLEAINKAAERVFAEKGSNRSRMPEIAAEAGISLGTLYGVIDGKKSLFFGIHKLRMREFMDCIRDASNAHDETFASHIAVLRLGGQFFLDHPDFLRICCRDGFGWATRLPASSMGNDLWDEGSAIPRDLFARGIAEGIYYEDEPELLVRKMLALKQVDLTHWVDQGMVTPHAEVLDRLEGQFVRAFCKRDA